MSEDIVKESIKCLANMEIKETTYQVARSVVLDEIERLQEDIGNYVNIVLHERKEIDRLHSIINKALEINKDIQEHLDKEFWIGRLELQEQILEGDKE